MGLNTLCGSCGMESSFSFISSCRGEHSLKGMHLRICIRICVAGVCIGMGTAVGLRYLAWTRDIRLPALDHVHSDRKGLSLLSLPRSPPPPPFSIAVEHLSCPANFPSSVTPRGRTTSFGAVFQRQKNKPIDNICHVQDLRMTDLWDIKPFKSRNGASGGSSESSKKIESVAGKNVCICLVSTQDRFAQARRIMPADCGATCVKFPASYQLLASMNATVH